MWNYRYGNDAVLDRRNRKADTVDTDRPLEHDKAVKFFRDAYSQPPVIVAEQLHRNELTRAVHVTLNQVPAQASGRKQRTLQIHQRARFQPPEVRAPESLRRE